MRDEFVKSLTELAESNPKVFLITGDLGFGVLTDFSKRFPKQFLNIGIAEQNMAGVATGLALEGRIVFIYSIGNFPTLRCLEQIRNDACYHGANVKVISIGGGFSYGALGMSHHATEDLAIMRALPGVTVVSPSDAWETVEATKAITSQSGVCYLRLDKSKAPVNVKKNEQFELGKMRVVREGKKVVFVSTGGLVGTVLNAANKLEEFGVSAQVVSVHTLKPFDDEGLKKLVSEFDALITIEEHNVVGGLAGVVAESLLQTESYPKKFYKIGLSDTYSSVVGSQDFLRKYYGMDEAAIVEKTLSLLKKD